MQGGWVYILTNRPNGILYTGVTRDLRGAWKVRLIHAMNPDWNDLYETLNQ